jgi:hypothetical protein
MDQETQGWLVGVPFDTNQGTHHERLRLSARHKWELANLTGVVMASTVFFLTPLMVSAPPHDTLEPGPSTVEGTGPSSVEDARPSGASGANESSVAEGQENPATLQTGVGRGTIRMPVGTSSPALQSTRSVVSRRPSAQALAVQRSAQPLRPAIVRAVNAPSSSAQSKERDRRRKGISNGLLRVLVGSGRHRVQPFPTPDSGN